ncbi:MAG: lipoprotein signal peptidase [Bacteroidales bacterium]|nr:lipoprotein signal peptidase [Bacteroidales bacterium]
MKKKSIIIVSFVVLILILDQLLKFWVKTNMYLGEEINLIGTWFKLHFIENDGMAFGMVFFGGHWGKLILSIFRIVASVFIGWIIYKMIRKHVSWGLLITMALVFTGAVGNIFDCIFYGKIFSASEYHAGIATLFPDGNTYAPFLQGKVVDMIQFDLFTIQFPDWLPMLGNSSFNFFPAVFNIADSCITIGLFTMIICYYKSLSAFVASFETSKKGTKVKLSEEERKE